MKNPTTNTFSGTLTLNSTGSYIETVNIDLNVIDNNGGSGIETTYYTLENSTGVIYLPYITPITVNGVGNYTLNYYSIDKFRNKESVKTINFALTELPETYAGNISGYVFEDTNNNLLKDIGENTMAGWKMCIDKNNDGYYEFDSLKTGAYHVLEIPHQNWVVTNPTNKYYNIILLNGQIVINKNFGNFKVKQNGK